MKARLITASLLVAVTVFWYFASAPQPDKDLIRDLTHRETVARNESTDEKDSVNEAATKVEDEISVRSAIPELPEYKWDATRAWNLPLNNPPIATASEAHYLQPDDYVLGVLLRGKPRAYPWYVLANYHAINDKIGSKFVIVTLCEACNGGAAFLAETEHAIIDFRPCGIKNGTWYAVDFQTGSHWYPFIGEAFAGPLKGTKLERIRSYFCTWRQWVSDHPDTTVILSNEEVTSRSHGLISHMANEETLNPELLARIATAPPNPKSELLPPYELVFGLIPDGDVPAKAIRIERLRRLEFPLQMKLGEVPLVLFLQDQYQVGAYVRRLDGEELKLEVVSEDPFLMKDQFGNEWNAWGRREAGPSPQSELPVADGYLTKWYEWLENFPNTELIAD